MFISGSAALPIKLTAFFEWSIESTKSPLSIFCSAKNNSSCACCGTTTFFALSFANASTVFASFSIFARSPEISASICLSSARLLSKSFPISFIAPTEPANPFALLKSIEPSFSIREESAKESNFSVILSRRPFVVGKRYSSSSSASFESRSFFSESIFFGKFSTRPKNSLACAVFCAKTPAEFFLAALSSAFTLLSRSKTFFAASKKSGEPSDSSASFSIAVISFLSAPSIFNSNSACAFCMSASFCFFWLSMKFFGARFDSAFFAFKRAREAEPASPASIALAWPLSKTTR